MIKKYAQGTTVTVEKSRAEIESLVKKNGGKNFCYFSSPNAEVFIFEAFNRRLKFTVKMPKISGYYTTKQLAEKTQAEYRRLFRVLILRLKAKFESVKSGDVSADEEFLANIVDYKNQTVWEAIEPTLERFEADKLPKLLMSSI